MHNWVACKFACGSGKSLAKITVKMYVGLAVGVRDQETFTVKFLRRNQCEGDYLCPNIWIHARGIWAAGIQAGGIWAAGIQAGWIWETGIQAGGIWAAGIQAGGVTVSRQHKGTSQCHTTNKDMGSMEKDSRLEAE